MAAVSIGTLGPMDTVVRHPTARPAGSAAVRAQSLATASLGVPSLAAGDG
jgi:hypothetical protein